jgi:hypothetical protein
MCGVVETVVLRCLQSDGRPHSGKEETNEDLMK